MSTTTATTTTTTTTRRTESLEAPTRIDPARSVRAGRRPGRARSPSSPAGRGGDPHRLAAAAPVERVHRGVGPSAVATAATPTPTTPPSDAAELCATPPRLSDEAVSLRFPASGPTPHRSGGIALGVVCRFAPHGRAGQGTAPQRRDRREWVERLDSLSSGGSEARRVASVSWCGIDLLSNTVRCFEDQDWYTVRESQSHGTIYYLFNNHLE